MFTCKRMNWTLTSFAKAILQGTNYVNMSPTAVTHGGANGGGAP